MPPEPKKPAPEPRKHGHRDTREAVVEDADENAGRDRDLAHGEGGTIKVPETPSDLNRDD
jgi:hypothetical protein